MTLYAAFDPGHTTGLAVANETGIQGYLVIRFMELENALINWKKAWGEFPDTVIIEEYRKNPEHFNRVEKTGSKIETVQVIGMIKMWCKINDIKCIEQQRDKKAIGYMNWGKKPLAKSNSMNHAYDACAHLVYWLVSKGKMRVKT